MFALVFGLLAVPLGLVIAVVVAATSGLPVIYRGERVGRGGRIFTINKFRTLRRDAETRLGPYLGEELVGRTELEYTRVGRWLKATQLDELPQLWNVLRGDMSFVGPRPIRPRFFEELAARASRRTGSGSSCAPGLTGFAQVRRGYETSMAEKLAHDLEWIADRSVARSTCARSSRPPGACSGSRYTSRRESSRSRSRWTRCMTSSAMRPSLRSATIARRSASSSSRRARW